MIPQQKNSLRVKQKHIDKTLMNTYNYITKNV